MLNLSELVKVVEEIEKIYESNLTGKRKYDMVFGLCAEKLWGNLPGFSYYDPDTTYQEDVEAVVKALREYVQERQEL